MARHELNDEQWRYVEQLLVRARGRGRHCRDLRRIVNGVLWLLRTGAPWRDLPRRYGPWATVYYHFARWRDAGTWEHLVEHLQSELDCCGALDSDLWCVDGSNVRAAKAAAGARKRGVVMSSRRIMRSVGPEGAGARNCTW